MKNKVFVYGTLKDSNKEDTFVVKGNLYNLGPFPGIKLTDNENYIPGQVIEVTDEELLTLDRYEGCPYLYVRRKTSAYFSSIFGSEPEDVWIYEYNGDVSSATEIHKW